MLVMPIRLSFDTERNLKCWCTLVVQRKITVHFFALPLPCASEPREVRTAYYF
jgi:hypothetical protein